MRYVLSMVDCAGYYRRFVSFCVLCTCKLTSCSFFLMIPCYFLANWKTPEAELTVPDQLRPTRIERETDSARLNTSANAQMWQSNGSRVVCIRTVRCELTIPSGCRARRTKIAGYLNATEATKHRSGKCSR